MNPTKLKYLLDGLLKGKFTNKSTSSKSINESHKSNCKDANDPEFRRNLRSLVDWHKLPRVALLETKLQDHLILLNDFLFNRIIEVQLLV